MVARSLEIPEHERAVPPNRAARRETELVVDRLRLRERKDVARRGCARAVELEQAAVQVVRARPERDVDDGAARASKLRLVIGGRDIDGLERLDRRDQHLEQSAAVVVVDAFDLDVVRHSRLAVHVRGQAVLRVEELRMLARQPRRARHEDHQALKVAVEQERYVGELPRPDLDAGVRAIRLERGRRRRHLDRLARGSRLEHEVGPDGAVDPHLDTVAHGLAEPGHLDHDAVGPALEVGEHVMAARVGLGRAADPRVRLDDRDRCGWHDAAGSIGDRPEQRPLDGLPVRHPARDYRDH